MYAEQQNIERLGQGHEKYKTTISSWHSHTFPEKMITACYIKFRG